MANADQIGMSIFMPIVKVDFIKKITTHNRKYYAVAIPSNAKKLAK